jgi:hypothetical protein
MSGIDRRGFIGALLVGGTAGHVLAKVKGPVTQADLPAGSFYTYYVRGEHVTEDDIRRALGNFVDCLPDRIIVPRWLLEGMPAPAYGAYSGRPLGYTTATEGLFVYSSERIPVQADTRLAPSSFRFEWGPRAQNVTIFDAFCLTLDPPFPGSVGNLHGMRSGDPYPSAFKAGWVAYHLGDESWGIRWAAIDPGEPFALLRLGGMMGRAEVLSGPARIEYGKPFTFREATQALIDARNQPRKFLAPAAYRTIAPEGNGFIGLVS